MCVRERKKHQKPPLHSNQTDWHLYFDDSKVDNARLIGGTYVRTDVRQSLRVLFDFGVSDGIAHVLAHHWSSILPLVWSYFCVDYHNIMS